MRVLIGGRLLSPATRDKGRYAFVLPPTADGLVLLSRAAKPNDARPWIADQRRLGVMVSRLELRIGDALLRIPLDHPQLDDGWWDVEWHGPLGLRRWTNGHAWLPIGTSRPALLEVEIDDGGTLEFPLGTWEATAPRSDADTYASDPNLPGSPCPMPIRWPTARRGQGDAG